MTEAPPKPDASSASVQLEPVLDAMIESMIVIDERGRMETVNRATTTMFGYEKDELLGKNINILMTGADEQRHDNYLSNYKKTGKKRIIGKGREVQARRKDGSYFPADIAVGEVGMGNSKRYIGLVRDLSAQRATEEQALRQREEMVNVSRLSMMGEMAAAMAHELNQPLAAIANYASASKRLLEQDTANSPDVIEVLEEITNQALRAGEVIQRTRTFTRSADAAENDTTLADVAHDIHSLAELDAKANNIRLVWNIPADLPSISVDAVQVQQVILNLIRNAVDAMKNTPPSDRHVLVTGKMTAPHEIRLEVSDNGTGVSEEVANNVFNAFFTTKSTGMGMGLAICRTIIRSHGGELAFRNNNRSNGGRGATFFFTLPTKVS